MIQTNPGHVPGFCFLRYAGAAMDGQSTDVNGPWGQTLKQYRQAVFRQLIAPSPAVIRVVSGTKRIRWETGEIEAHAGDLVILTDALPLTVENLPAPRGIYQAEVLPFTRKQAHAAYDRMEAARAFERRAGCAVASATGTIDEAFNAVFWPSAGRSEAIHSLRVEELLIWLAEAGAWLGADVPANLTSRLRKLIVDKPQFDWSADEAARNVGMSAATLRRRLAAEGTGFAAILADVRMTLALGLLQTTDWKVGRIAAAIGYESQSRFAVRFRLRFGTAPHEIRRSSL